MERVERGGKGWKSGVDRMEKGGKGGKSRWVGQVKTRGSFGWLEPIVGIYGETMVGTGRLVS